MAQKNLVPNSGFEVFISCPPGIYNGGQVEKAIPWFNPTQNSPDYCNSCYIGVFGNYLDVPYNLAGHQYARSGNAYCGFATYYSTPDGREYIEVPLLDSLSSGVKYIIEMWVSKGDTGILATNGIAAFFSKNKITDPSIYLLPYTPQVENPEVIKDTLNWVLFSTEFIAQGGDKFITIGNFRADSNTTVDTVRGAPYWWNIAYYYIDDVSIYCVDSGYSTASAGSDKIVCAGDSVQLGAPSMSGYTYSWSPTYGMDPVAGLDSAGATQAQPWVMPQKTTTYILTVVDTVRECRGPGHDSVTVAVCSGVEEFQVSGYGFQVYPNPSGKEIKISYLLQGKEKGAIEILNVIGERVAHYYLNPLETETVINTATMENGIYFYCVRVNERTVITDRLVVIH